MKKSKTTLKDMAIRVAVTAAAFFPIFFLFSEPTDECWLKYQALFGNLFWLFLAAEKALSVVALCFIYSIGRKLGMFKTNKEEHSYGQSK